AQSEAATGKPLANFWLHSTHLRMGGRKMSKRTGNVLYVKQLERMGVSPCCLRFYLISKRYRSPLDFTMEKFMREIGQCDETGKTMRALRKLARRSGGSGKKGDSIARKLLHGFESAMDNDLNTTLAFRRIFRVTNEIRKFLSKGKLTPQDAKCVLHAMEKIDKVLGVFF
ncbi:MAG: class I tRNA ligase family protein, partial [Candidatus ainarchaeum sp.]|nr:class I tRNA ligase family protein [Candidatus ainarchaeum sp.]